MSYNYIPAAITTSPIIPCKGLYYIGQYGTSGYATAARGYLYNYFINGIPITWDPLYFDDSTLSDTDVYDIVVKSLINKPMSDHDMVIMHSTPDIWPSFWKDKLEILRGKMVIGYCTWETNKLPKDWVDCINSTVNEVWCPSTYNQESFINSGVKVNIKVVPHVFLPRLLPDKNSVKLINVLNGSRIERNDNIYTFYSIGELNPRKGIDDLIKVFCESFTEKDSVRLILKIHYKNYSIENKKKCEEMISTELKKYKSHPQIICLFDNISANDILALHCIGDCYISLTKSEGFGLTIFDAFNYNKKIIATGYSGYIDFLGKNYPGLVNYKIGPVKGMSSFSNVYTEDQEWAYPDLNHVKELIKNIYK